MRALTIVALASSFFCGWLLAGKRHPGISRQPTSVKRSIPSGPLKTVLPQALVWNANNPLAAIVTKFTGGARVVALAKLVEQTPVDELGHLLDLAASCPQTDVRKTAQELVYAKWVAGNPEGALNYAKITAVRTGKADALNSVFAAWASLDPQAALAAAQELDRPAFRAAGIAQVFSNWAQSGQTDDALAALNKLGNGKIAGPLTEKFFENWSKIDPAGALAAINKITSPTTRIATLNLILCNMAASDPQGAFDLVLTQPPSLALLRYNSVSGNNVPLAGAEGDIYNKVFALWAQQDPTAAFASLAQLPAGIARDRAMEAVLISWWESDSTAALQATQSLAPGAAKIRIETNLLRSMTATDPSSAANFLAVQPKGIGYGTLLNTLVSGWSENDPAAALAWVNQHVTGTAYDTSLGTILGQMGKIDAPATATFIARMPADGLQNDYMNQTMSQWGQVDPAGAAAWAHNNLTGSTQTVALAGVANGLANTNPAAAAELLGQMPNASARNSAILSLASKWAQLDPQAATQWLKNLPSDLPDADRSTAEQNVSAVTRTKK